MRRSRKFFKRGSNFDGFFLNHYERAIIDPPAKHHLYGVSMAFQWRAYIGQKLHAGLVAL